MAQEREDEKEPAEAAPALLSESQIKNLGEVFAKYVVDKKVLVADANNASRAGLGKQMITMGAKTANVTMAQSFSLAMDCIKQQKPEIIVSDFNLDGPHSGLELVREQKRQGVTSAQSLFFLVTGNATEAAVAGAAEEEVDAYVLKPYTIGMLTQQILRAAASKMVPSDYQKEIAKGREALEGGRYDEALVIFQKASGMAAKPTLAHYYTGVTYTKMKTYVLGEQAFALGLKVNRIHYKCMVGLFELQLEREKHEEAYETSKRISMYYPVSAERLAQTVKLAILTRNYADIERYYQAFKDISVRTEELIRYICAALVVCGKYYLQMDFKSRAVDLFSNAMVTSAGRVSILKEIILAYATAGLGKEAAEVLKRFPPETHLSVDFQVMSMMVADLEGARGDVIKRGRQLVAAGTKEPMAYALLIKGSAEAGYTDSAESLMQDASRLWPERTQQFKDALEGKLKRGGVSRE